MLSADIRAKKIDVQTRALADLFSYTRLLWFPFRIIHVAYSFPFSFAISL